MEELLSKVNDEKSFLEFVKALHADRLASESMDMSDDGFQKDWANHTVGSFIEAAIAWSQDSSFGTRPGPKPDNPWKIFALFLWAGSRYE